MSETLLSGLRARAVTGAASLIAAATLSAAPSLAQDTMGPTEEERDASFTVTMNQDPFFGFYPAFNGLIPVSEDMDFSFYGIFWTTPSFGTGGGSDLWTEFGAGVNLHYMDGNLTVKPQLGILSGVLLSGGERRGGAAAGSNVFDGVVPNITINYSDDKFEAEYYGGYYLALRQRTDNAALDFIHTWANAGYKVTDFMSFGGHVELLSNSRTTFPGGEPTRNYLWLGPYAQFSTDNGFFARFTAGADLEPDSPGNFYKLNVGFSF